MDKVKAMNSPEYKRRLESKMDADRNVYVFNELSLEITRRCPLDCAHCLKGDQQTRGMSRAVMENFFQHTMGIRHLGLASGETAFAINKIKMLNEVLREYRPTIESVFVYTNGVKITDEYIRELNGLRDYVIESSNAMHDGKADLDLRAGFASGNIIESKCPLVVILSNDTFHKEARARYFEKNNIDLVAGQQAFELGVVKLSKNFPVVISEKDALFHIGRARELSGVRKYKVPAEHIAIWKTSVSGVNVVHTYSPLGVYYDGAIGSLMKSYAEQDRSGVEYTADKTMYQRLLEVEGAFPLVGNRSDFIGAVTKEQKRQLSGRFNPLNYTKKSEPQITPSSASQEKQ